MCKQHSHHGLFLRPPPLNTHGYGAVEAGAAGDEEQAAAAADLGHVVLDAAQQHAVVVEQHAPAHRVHHRLGLLEDLLLHERAVVACEARAWRGRMRKQKHIVIGREYKSWGRRVHKIVIAPILKRRLKEHNNGLRTRRRTFHDLLYLELEREDLATRRLVGVVMVTPDAMNRQAAVADGRHVIVLDVHDLVRVLNDGAVNDGKR